MQILVLRVGILFIVNRVIGASVMMGLVLGRESICYAGANTSMLAGEGVSHRECDIFRFLVLAVHTHDVTLIFF